MGEETRFYKKIASLLNISDKQVSTTIQLLDEGATIPFISRYRKEMTGSLDEVQIANVRDEIDRLRVLEKRREFVIETIDSQGKLTPELTIQIMSAETISVLEDIYLPYKPKRRTRATIAREKGLEPLAEFILVQSNANLNDEAKKYISDEKQVTTIDEALDGARDIIAELINENAEARQNIRNLFIREASITSKVMRGKEEKGEKFTDYFEWEEPVMACPSHRMLAMRRGEAEEILSLNIAPSTENALEILNRQFVKSNNKLSEQVKLAVEESYDRLMKTSIESEIRVLTKNGADEKAIQVFADNLRELLLASPLGQKAILAIDPGFRTGCKVVALDKQGKLLEDTVIYPHEKNREELSKNIVLAFCAKHNLEAIAIGNGTASRETENFIRSIKEIPSDIPVIMVNESGASIYSASAVAREEFPDKDVTVRGAVSIGRRLADPLAELVKIDAKSIGVGQYQHDVDQKLLKKKLDEVVESSVNKVGVELNTASKELLTYVSGLGAQLAQNIIEYRNTNGPFKTRKALLAVPRMGDKAFEQAAGFLRIAIGVHPLDKSAVHPESYHIVEKMASDLKCSIEDLMENKELRKKINLQNYVSEKFGLPTLNDIMNELDKPGRDPRKSFETFSFDNSVHSIEDLREGMKLPGIVTNVTNFGAFVDIGVHQDGLVHISQLSDTFVDDPNKVVKVQQQVTVTVTEVDVQRKRIALSMKGQGIPVAGNTIGSFLEAKPKQSTTQTVSQPETNKKGTLSSFADLKAKFDAAPQITEVVKKIEAKVSIPTETKTQVEETKIIAKESVKIETPIIKTEKITEPEKELSKGKKAAKPEKVIPEKEQYLSDFAARLAAIKNKTKE
ncbi:MAG: Tex-like N-terminal domain-containing protein [Bacteroidota bacterium]